MIIYKITNKINSKIYIGKTSGLLSRRISSHKSESSKKVFRSNQPIHKAIRKYGFDNFEICVLENNIENAQLLNSREQYFIDLLKSTDRNVGYNLTSGGDGGNGMSKDKNGMFGKKRPDLSERNAKNKGKTYEDIYGTEKAQAIKNSISNNSNVIISEKRKIESSKRLKDMWESGVFSTEEHKKIMANRPQNLVSKNKIRIFCPELNMEFESVHAAAKHIGSGQGNVSNVLNGKLKSCKGYTFKRVQNEL